MPGEDIIGYDSSSMGCGKRDGLVLMANFSKGIANRDRIEYESKVRANLPKRIYTEQHRQKDSAILEGDAACNRLKNALQQVDEEGTYRRDPHQVKVHNSIIVACLPQLYGDDLLPNLHRLSNEYKVQQITPQIMVPLPRRWGKTYLVCIYVACYLYTQPGAECVIYSTSKRASGMVLDLVYNIVCVLLGKNVKQRIVKKNEETFRFIGYDGRTLSRCDSYPSNVAVSTNHYLYLLLFFLLYFVWVSK
jgi:hypothetical protein